MLLQSFGGIKVYRGVKVSKVMGEKAERESKKGEEGGGQMTKGKTYYPEPKHY